LYSPVTFSAGYALDWNSSRRPRLDIEYVLLEAVAGGHDRLSTLPPTPTPPSKTISKRDARCWSASTGRMLKIVALVTRAILEESAVEVVV
jgi:hypothetical protein